MINSESTVCNAENARACVMPGIYIKKKKKIKKCNTTRERTESLVFRKMYSRGINYLQATFGSSIGGAHVEEVRSNFFLQL